MRKADDRSLLDSIAARYAGGECGTFAIALSDLTGLPVVLFRIDGDSSSHYSDGFPRHAAVQVAADTYIDGFGLVEKMDIEERLAAKFRIEKHPDLAAYPFDEPKITSAFQDALRHANELLSRLSVTCISINRV